MDVDELAKTLKKWMNWCRNEQFLISTMTLSYMPEVNDEYRKGYVDALNSAESWLGLLMFEKGIDLRLNRGE